MKSEYHAWLKREGYDEGTIAAQLYRVARVEEFHGSLDSHFERDKLATLVETLTYSTEDQRNDRPNPSKIPFNGNKRNNPASYKSAVLWYRRFLEGGGSGEHSALATAKPLPKTVIRSSVKLHPERARKRLLILVWMVGSH